MRLKILYNIFSWNFHRGHGVNNFSNYVTKNMRINISSKTRSFFWWKIWSIFESVFFFNFLWFFHEYFFTEFWIKSLFYTILGGYQTEWRPVALAGMHVSFPLPERSVTNWSIDTYVPTTIPITPNIMITKCQFFNLQCTIRSFLICMEIQAGYFLSPFKTTRFFLRKQNLKILSAKYYKIIPEFLIRLSQ